jgi:hypothetical protein
LKDNPKFTQNWDFGLKINHLATLQVHTLRPHAAKVESGSGQIIVNWCIRIIGGVGSDLKVLQPTTTFQQVAKMFKKIKFALLMLFSNSNCSDKRIRPCFRNSQGQGDQIGRIFAYWAIVHLCQFYDNNRISQNFWTTFFPR